MKVMWKAACAAVLLVAASFQIGCGETYRPIAVPLPVTTGNPTGSETEVVLNTSPGLDSAITNIDVSGDSNAGNKVLGNVVGSASGTLAATMVAPIAFAANRGSVYTANTMTDSVTQVLLQSSTAGFAANTTTISLDPGSQPIGLSFQYFGATYTQDYVVNSNLGKTDPSVPRTCPVNVGSLGAIIQASAQLKTTICLNTTANPNTPANPFPNPVFAWIYKDQSKVFVLDKTANLVDVVSASKYEVTNTIAVGKTPVKATQSTDGTNIYVLNSGDGSTGSTSISIIDGQAETVVGTIPLTTSSSLPIDIAQDVQFNRIWVLQLDGTVSIFNATTPGVLTLIAAVRTIPPALAGAPATTLTATNLAVMLDGTQAYVGIAGTDRIVVIRGSDFTTNQITVGVHRAIPATCDATTGAGCVEVTKPTVNYVAVSRDNTKAYAATRTATNYYYLDANGNPISVPIPLPAGCTPLSANAMTCTDLYNGTAVVAAVGNGPTSINTYITTVAAPSVVTYCEPAARFDGQSLCPALNPVVVLGRS